MRNKDNEQELRPWGRVGVAHAYVIDALNTIHIKLEGNPELEEIGFFDGILDALEEANEILRTTHAAPGMCPADTYVDALIGKAVPA